MTISRRWALFAAGLVLSASAFAGDTPANKPLKQVFKDAFLMGAAINGDIVSGKNRAAQQIVAQQLNTVTLENGMKAEIIQPERGQFQFEQADAFVAFAEQHNVFTIGHTLVWHNQTPDWFFHDTDGKPNTPEKQLKVLEDYIKVVAGRYHGKVDAWDVVNEVIAEDGSYRPTKWVNAVGDGDTLVKASFKFAERYAPDTELYYNDFNAWRPEKRDGIIRMIKMLQAEGIRIDGVGIQGHWGLNYPKTEYIEQAIDAYTAAGVNVMISELDIDVLPLTREGQIIGTGLLHPQYDLEEFKTYLDPYQGGLPADVQQQLTKRYTEIFALLYRKRDKIDRVTFWGVDDSMSWKNGYPIRNRTNYPLPWNRDFSEKPALNAIRAIAK